MQVKSPFLVDLVSPVILEKAMGAAAGSRVLFRHRFIMFHMFHRDLMSCFWEAPTFNTVEWLLLLRRLELLEPDVLVLEFLAESLLSETLINRSQSLPSTPAPVLRRGKPWETWAS